MGADRPDVVRLVEPPLYGGVLNEVALDQALASH
jgi:hypothetical protein